MQGRRPDAILESETIDPQVARLPNPGLLIKVQPGTTEVRVLAVGGFAPMGSMAPEHMGRFEGNEEQWLILPTSRTPPRQTT
jgi:hypothetical protein